MGAVVERGKSAGNGVHYEISYGGRECPFAGIDSTALDPYIGPNQITQNSANVIELTNTLEAISWQQIFSLNSPDIIIGIGDLLGQVFIVSFNVATTTINVNGYPNFPSQTGAYLIGSVAVPNAISTNIVPGTLTFKNVNGICFFSFPWLPYILQHNNTVASVLTNYLGCAFLNELNGRLIAANIFETNYSGILPTGSQTGTVQGSQYSTNITYNNSQYEYDVLFRTTGSVGTGVLTDYIIFTKYGLNVPLTATILGVQGILNWYGQQVGSGIIENVALYYLGAVIGTVKTPAAANTTTPTSVPFGSDTDDWGATLTPAIVNDPSFGIGYQIQTGTGSSTRSFFVFSSVQVTYQLAQYNVVPGMATATANQIGVGTSVQGSSPITFPNLAISGINVGVQFDVIGQANWFQGNGNLAVQYSIDGGTTWVTAYSFGTSGTKGNANYATTANIISIPATGLTNLNQIQIRALSTAAAVTNGNTFVSTTLQNIAVISGAALVISEFPYQFAWSAPSGAYAQFNPLVNGLVTGAGYNNLPDVEDEITGMFMTGPTAYVLRNEGITEVTPLSSGVEPFAFNHLWASHKGIGTIYSNSVMQYGSLGAFLSDSDVYTIGYDGINTIAKKAKQAIYSELITENAANFLCGNLDAFSLKSNVFIGASLAIAQPATPFEIIIYTFKQDTNEWFRFTVPTGITQSYGMQFASVQAIGVPLLFNAQGSINNCTIYALPVSCGIQIANDPTTIVFPAEELFFERDVTVDGIGLYIAGIENIDTVITCTVKVNGTVFSAINDQEVSMNGSFMYIKLWPTGLPFTGMSPQLTLQVSVTGTSNVLDNLTIGKIVLFVTVDPTQRPI